jgi:hypothetical protein
VSHGPLISGETCQYDWLPTISSVLSARTKNATTAATGAVNRLGISVPAANPSAARAGKLAPATIAGHHSGPPQLAWRAVAPYVAARQTRYPASAQQLMAAHATSCRAHAGRAVMLTSSAVRRRASLVPIQAAAPTTGVMKSTTAPLCKVAARTFHSGGMAMALRYVVSQNRATAAGRIHSIALWRSSSQSSRAVTVPRQ